MDVRMPDGTVITNVPEGTTQSQLLKMVNNTKMSSPDVFKETAQEQSGVKNFLAGVGGGMKGLALGAGQRLGLVDQSTIDDHMKAMEGLRSTGAGTVGDVVGTAAALAPMAFLPGANTALGASAYGALSGAINPTKKDESVLGNMALGGAGGYVGQRIGNAIGSAFAGKNNINSSSASASSSGGSAGASSTVTGGATARGTGGGYNFGSVGADQSAGLNQSQKQLLERINNSTAIDAMGGFKLTPGQASGSRALQQMEAKLESQPMTSGTFNEIKSHNQRTLNRAASAAIGENSDTLDSSVLQNARERIGSVYKMVADKRDRPIDPDAFLNRLGAIEGEFEGLANISENPLVKKFFNFASKGQANGEQLQDLASKLGKAANSQMTSGNGDRQLGMALFQVKDHVDDLLESGLSGSTLRTFQEARGQYRNLMLLTSRQGIVNPSTGNISGANLANTLQVKDKGGYLFGGNESALYDAARFSQGFKPIVGDSGTATRMPLPSPTDFLLSLPFSIATKAYTSTPSVNLAANASNIAANGLMPNQFGQFLGKRGGQMGLIGGGLLGQAQ